MRDAEPPDPTAAQSGDATVADDEWEESPRVTSLRPTLAGFSQRRLLNAVSVAVVAVALLALVIHWLPDVLPRQPNAAATRTTQAINALLPPARGTGWKPIGPDSAQDIAFTANGALGYVCEKSPLDAAIAVAVYDVHQNTWKELPTPATGDSCQVFVSPQSGAYVLLSVDHCLTVGNCSDSYSASRLYESFDGGENWTELHLPTVVNVYSVAWAKFDLYLAVRGNLAADSATIPPNAPSHLLVRHENGSLTEVDAQQLVGRPTRFSNIALISSGTTLYASLDEMPCASYCTIQVRSDDGARWTSYSANYKGSPIIPQAAAPYSYSLVGWAFLPTSGVLVPLQSDDGGDYWWELPAFPANPSTGGAVMFAAPDDSIYAFCYGDTTAVYTLRPRSNAWRLIAPLPNGTPVTVQYDASGHAIALWGRADTPTSTLGLEYYPLQGSR